MNNHSYIALLKHDGSVYAIYCHWNGYPSYAGHLLYNNYNNYSDITDLLNLGDISILGDSIETTKAYIPTSYPNKYYSLDNFLNQCATKYNYIFMNNQWYYRRGSHKLQKLTDRDITLDR